MKHKNFKPYYAVIFTSLKKENTTEYDEMGEKMVALARQQPGFIGVDSARNDVGITVSYWETTQAILQWKANTDHLIAQRNGKEKWYSWYNVKICLVEREYSFENL